MKVRSCRSIFILPVTAIGFIVLVLIAIRLAQESVADWQLRNLLQKQGVVTEAVVVELHIPRSTGASTIKYQFHVTTAQGNQESHYGSAVISGSDVDHFQPGAKVIVIYNPANPDKSMIRNSSPDYSLFITTIPVVAVALIGVIAFIGAGIRVLLVLRK